MVERLNPLDASFLYLEEPATPMHVGGLLVLDALHQQSRTLKLAKDPACPVCGARP